MRDKEQQEQDREIIILVEEADAVMLQIRGKRVALGSDIIADIVRLMKAGVEQPMRWVVPPQDCTWREKP